MFIFTRSKSERRKNFVGNQIDECKDLSGLYYLLPFQKGYLVNWDTQRQVWDYLFGEDCRNIKPQDMDLIVTEPMHNFPSIQEAMSEIFFEDYKFKSVLCLPSVFLSYLNYARYHADVRCALIVDSGYSFTHIVPMYKGKAVVEGVVRIDVGGKLLTNQLKETVSYRQLHVLDETYVINQAKEDICYVALDFVAEMEESRKKGANRVKCEYVLPNFSNRRRGYIKTDTAPKHTEDEQSLILSNERITTPELLFSPSNIGISQMGLAEAIVHSISLTPSEMHPHLYANIVLTGGNFLFSGFKSRLLSDVRRLCPEVYDVSIYLPDDPIGYAWKGGTMLCDSSIKPDYIKGISSEEYKEIGSFSVRKCSEFLYWPPFQNGS